MVDGNQTNGDVITSDANGVGSWAAPAGVPSGLIAMFDSACPAGYTEVTAFQNKFPRGHDGDATYCETGGSDSATVPLKCHSHTGGLHTHCMPSVGVYQGQCYNAAGCDMNPGGGGYCHNSWRCAGYTNECSSVSGGAVATSSCGDCASPTLSTIPAYREVVFCKKD